MCVCSTIGKHTLACNRHSVFFTAVEHWSNVPWSLFAAQYTYSDFICLWISSIILQWDIYQHTKVFHLVKKLYTYTIQKNIWWSRLFIILGGKRTPIVLLQLQNNFVFISIVTTNLQKTLVLESTNIILGLNKHIQSAEIRWFTNIFSIVHAVLVEPSCSENSSR